jgi:protein-L-isoaspartate(D-aspartate) O-methyltransferase
MKPMNEQHFAILRRHMVEVIGIHTDLLEGGTWESGAR